MTEERLDSPQPAPQTPSAAQGVMHLFPLKVHEHMTITGMLAFGLTPWGIPGGLGAAGHRTDDQVELLLLAYEQPIEQFQAPSGLGKGEIERLYLERFRTDWLLRSRQLAYGSIERGADPPDFLGDGPEGRIGLDLTSLAIAERMTADAWFRRLRDAIREQPRERLAHLAGTTVYMWFDDQGFSSLPPKKDDALSALLTALERYRFDPALVTRDVAGGLPGQLGDIGRSESGAGGHFYAVPLTNAAPMTRFFAETGFELGLAYQTYHDAASAWNEICRLISSHDKPEIHTLIIEVGAPDRFGFTHPGEIALAEFALERTPPSIEPQHLQQVLVHFWPDGRVFRVYPRLEGIAGPLYRGGNIPGHLMLAAPQPGPASS